MSSTSSLNSIASAWKEEEKKKIKLTSSNRFSESVLFGSTFISCKTLVHLFFYLPFERIRHIFLICRTKERELKSEEIRRSDLRLQRFRQHRVFSRISVPGVSRRRKRRAESAEGVSIFHRNTTLACNLQVVRERSLRIQYPSESDISRRNKSYDEKIATVLVFRLGNRIKEGTIRAGDPI